MKDITIDTSYDEDIERLIYTTYSIYTLYTKNENISDEAYQEYLQMAIERENAIYDKLNIRSTNYDYIINRFNYLLKQKRYKNNDEMIISERVFNYIDYILWHHPFPSIQKNKKQKENENFNIIINHVEIDYTNISTYLLNKAADETKSKKEKDEILAELNLLEFSNKFIKNKKISDIKLSEKERCYIFYDKNFVDTIYDSFCENIVSNRINECLSYTNEDLHRQINKINFDIIIIYIKAALYIASPNTITEILRGYNSFLNKLDHNDIFTNNSKSISAINNLIETFTNKKENEKIKKQKI